MCSHHDGHYSLGSEAALGTRTLGRTGTGAPRGGRGVTVTPGQTRTQPGLNLLTLPEGCLRLAKLATVVRAIAP